MSWLRNSISLAGATTLLGLALSSCADNESMLFVQGVLAIDQTDCVATPEANATMYPSGILDLSLTSRYSAALLVASQLTQRGSREQLRTESARLSLEGAEVTLEDSKGPITSISPNPFTSRGTGLANPAAGTEPGYAAMFVDLVPASISPNLPDGQITAKIRVFGTTLGGQEIESKEFRFQIQVCRGCLVDYGSGKGACVVTEDMQDSAVCLAGQDRRVPCAYCSGGNGVCANVCNNCYQAEASGLCPNGKPSTCP
ncbi:MAG TPA: hypothetical protein VFQ61_13815 [Polyangiaceae bacterium]|nr:hypothetical protein [Polyangiaceae bacterium]